MSQNFPVHRILDRWLVFHIVKDTYDLCVILTASDGVDDGEGKLALCQVLTVTLVGFILKSALGWDKDWNAFQVMFLAM